MKRKWIIIISILVIMCIVGFLLYEYSNKELLMGSYYNYDDGESCLELKEDGNFYFDVRIHVAWVLVGTYKVDDKYLVLYPKDEEAIKFEIRNKKLIVVDGGSYAEKLLTEGMKYKWSEEKSNYDKNNTESNGKIETETNKLIEQIFGVSKSEYEIIQENNGLDSKEYGGSYQVKLSIKKENMKTFIDEIEKEFSIPEDVDYFVNNKGNYIGENDIFYVRMGSVKRVIEEAEFIPKTCSSYIVFSEAINGFFEVEMEYLE